MRRLIFCAALLAACDPQMVDMPDLAMSSPDLAMAGCSPDFGRVYYVSSLQFVPMGMGFDLNGDGKIDNAMGALAGLANGQLKDSIALGTTIMLLSIVGMKGPPPVEGDMPAVAIYLGLDADQPANPSNNAMNGAFVVPAEQFDVNCHGTPTFDQSVFTGGKMVSHSKSISIVAGGIGTITMVNAYQEETPNADLTEWDGVTAGISPVCSNSLTPFPGPNPASILDVLVNVIQLQPDIDRDGDGIEQLVGDGTTIKECIDGDGTVIPGRSCPCDPRMQDGYSGALSFHVVPARVVGLVTSQ